MSTPFHCRVNLRNMHFAFFVQNFCHRVRLGEVCKRCFRFISSVIAYMPCLLNRLSSFGSNHRPNMCKHVHVVLFQVS